MPISLDQVTKEVDLNLPDELSDSIKNDIKGEVGDFLVTSILDYVGQGKSPVTGRAFKQLSKDYAEEQKGGRRLPNLELEGDMLGSLKAEKTRKGVEVGIFDSGQAKKAYNHNEGDTLPRRQFIPEPKQNFVGDIQKGIDEIVNRRIKDELQGLSEPRQRPRSTPSDTRSTQEITNSNVSVSSSAFNIFGDTSIDQIVRDIFSG